MLRRRNIVYRRLADGVAVVHLGYIGFVMAGGFLAWRRRWVLWLHVPAAGWALAIVTLGLPCPLTPLEKRLRRRAGQAGYAGGFVDHYLTGVVYPARLLGLARGLVAAAVAAGYAGLLIKWLRLPRRGGRSTVRRPGRG